MHKKTTTILGAVLLGLSVSAIGADDPENVIEYRDKVMHSLGNHAGAIAAILKGKVGYTDDVLPHARAIAATAETLDGTFPEGTGPDSGIETRALAAIWENPEAFDKAQEDFLAAARAFVKDAESGDRKQVLGGFKKLGDSCGGCHEDFRAEEDEHDHDH